MKKDAFNFIPVIRGSNKLEVKAEGQEAELVLIGAVGKSWWDDTGITEQEVRDALKSIPNGKKINARINSEGGSVKEGLGIYNAFKERRADITAHITGYALSIASIFPLGAGRVISPKSAIWMLHKAWSWNQGNADDMRQAAEMLDAHDETLVDIYAAETGKTKEEIRSAMEKETWVKGADAVAWGLADETDKEEETASAQYRPLAKDFISRCKNISPEILNAISAHEQGGAKNKQPQDNTMNRQQKIALLNSWGVQVKDETSVIDARLDELIAMGKEAAIAAFKQKPVATQEAQAAATAADNKEIADIKAELAKQRKDRITDKVNTYVDAQKITKAEVSIFVAAALTDEAATFKILDEKEAQTIGGEAAGFSIEIQDAGPNVSKNGVQGSKIIPELDNIFAAHKEPAGATPAQKAETAKARFEAIKAEFPRLLKLAARKDNGVQAANTFSATITTNFLIAGTIQKLSGRFAAANLFARDSEQDPYKPLAVGIRKFNTTATDGTQVQTNATDFEGLGAGGDSTIDPITITPAQLTSGGHITNAQLQSGFRVGDIIEKKLIDLAAKVTQILTAPITVANFTTNAALVVSPGAFGFSDLATLQGQLKKTLIKNLILDGEYQARIANTPGFFQTAGLTGGPTGAWRAFGWDNIALNTDWSGAGANVRGFACGQDAIGFISGMPINPPEGIPGNIVQIGMAQLPDVNIGIATYAWFSPASRTFFFTFDLIIGASLVDELQGVLVKSA